jgi:hypothetical protein
MRAAVEKELRGADATLGESEQRIGASLEKYSKQVRRVSTGQRPCSLMWMRWPK